VAWDCATGNGQAAVALSKLFRTVHATDVSSEQLSAAFSAPNIAYSAKPAEETDFASGTFDFVTVAQALHWFDFERFWPEVRRVAKRGAFFCAWGYAWFRYGEDVEAELVRPAMRLLEPYWAPQNRILWNGYRQEDIRFPFERIEAPGFVLELDTTVGGIIDYVRTWSAFKRAQAVPEVARALEQLLGRAADTLRPERRCRAASPLALVAGRVV
jgi:SAM-dependent methyltransferase